MDATMEKPKSIPFTFAQSTLVQLRQLIIDHIVDTQDALKEIYDDTRSTETTSLAKMCKAEVAFIRDHVRLSELHNGSWRDRVAILRYISNLPQHPDARRLRGKCNDARFVLCDKLQSALDWLGQQAEKNEQARVAMTVREKELDAREKAVFDREQVMAKADSDKATGRSDAMPTKRAR